LPSLALRPEQRFSPALRKPLITFAKDIVFITTSNDFASQSYQVQAFDYLLKPLTGEKVSHVMGKLKKSKENADKAGLSVVTQSTTRFVLFRDIFHSDLGSKGYWWSASNNGSQASFKSISNSSNTFTSSNSSKDYFYSVRCVKD